MYGFRRVAANLRRASPGRSWIRRRKKSGPAERVIPVDLVPSTTRHSRFVEGQERQERSLAWLFWIAFAIVACVIFMLARARPSSITWRLPVEFKCARSKSKWTGRLTAGRTANLPSLLICVPASNTYAISAAGIML